MSISIERTHKITGGIDVKKFSWYQCLPDGSILHVHLIKQSFDDKTLYFYLVLSETGEYVGLSNKSFKIAREKLKLTR